VSLFRLVHPHDFTAPTLFALRSIFFTGADWVQQESNIFDFQGEGACLKEALILDLTRFHGQF
jgi:hypothetical protein